MHLNGSLAVPDVVHFLVGNRIDILEDCWEIIICHMLESEFPKLFVFVWIVFSMIAGVFIASAVAKPDIISFVGQHESWGFVLVIDQPGIRTI